MRYVAQLGCKVLDSPENQGNKLTLRQYQSHGDTMSLTWTMSYQDKSSLKVVREIFFSIYAFVNG